MWRLARLHGTNLPRQRGNQNEAGNSMSGFEYVIAFLLVLVRLFLVGLVGWFVVREIRKSGKTGKRR